MNSVLSSASSRRLPEQRHAEQPDADADDQRRLHEADDDVGHDLAEHDLDRRDRHRQQAFHGAALDLARDRQRGEDQHGHGEDGADEARHDVERGVGRRIVAGVGADLERRRGAVGMARSCCSAVCTRLPSAAIAEPAATGSVASAATSSAGRSPRRTARSKLAGISIANSTAPGRQQAVELGLVRDHVGDLEILACSRAP